MTGAMVAVGVICGAAGWWLAGHDPNRRPIRQPRTHTPTGNVRLLERQRPYDWENPPT